MKYASLLLGISLSATAVVVNAAPATSGMEKSAQSMEQAVHKAQGKIDKIDKASGKMTVTHGPVASLKWSAMTMPFSVKDPAIFDSVKQGDKIDFEMVKEPDGNFAITKATPVK